MMGLSIDFLGELADQGYVVSSLPNSLLQEVGDMLAK